jgi:hypothetical protein
VDHPTSYLMGTADHFYGVKRLGRESDHSTGSTAKTKNGRDIPPFSVRLHGIVVN